MGKKIPFMFTHTITLAGNASGQMVFRGGEGETIYIRKIAKANTVANNQSKSFVFDIVDSNGQNYNATSTGATAADSSYSNKIDSRLIGDADHPTVLPQDLKLNGNQSITVNIEETSGSSNIIALAFIGYKELGTA